MGWGLAGCVQAPRVAQDAGCGTGVTSRGPTSYESNRNLTSNEASLCSTYPCQHFLAPCRLAASSHAMSASQLEDLYLDKADALTNRGYCAQRPRELDGPEYPPRTCLFLYIAQEFCTPAPE